MDYTIAQALALLAAHERIERQRLAQWLGIIAVATQGERRSVERLQQQLLKD
ncbi:hypothetical protein [Serpentinimonas maccroryi]|uniref:hypothetical protein n=1 Tax=Serpentinimonas maccroryi TaxID=1458426 RepID=UPI002034326B|nr:hypothetical protein [Serpentinimonas maccroryi]